MVMAEHRREPRTRVDRISGRDASGNSLAQIAVASSISGSGALLSGVARKVRAVRATEETPKTPKRCTAVNRLDCRPVMLAHGSVRQAGGGDRDHRRLSQRRQQKK
jgi:hypothetical protein